MIIPQLGVLTKTIVATKERLEGVGGREDGEGGEEIPGTITPAQRKREMEAVKKEVCCIPYKQFQRKCHNIFILDG